MIFIHIYYISRLSLSAIIRKEYWFTQRIKREKPLLTNIGYFGFPKECTMALKHVGILCVIYDFWGTRWRSWLRHCVTNRKGAGSIPDSVTGIFH
jgi:hypothetical protein